MGKKTYLFIEKQDIFILVYNAQLRDSLGHMLRWEGAQIFFKGTGEVGEIFKATGGGGGADMCALLDESAGLGAADQIQRLHHSVTGQKLKLAG